MPGVHLKRLLPGLKTLDMFGFTPHLNYQGQSTYTTYPGMIISVIVYGFIVMNAVYLTKAFSDGSKQDEKFNSELIERVTSGPMYFSDNKFEIAVVTNGAVLPKHGEIVAY